MDVVDPTILEQNIMKSKVRRSSSCASFPREVDLAPETLRRTKFCAKWIGLRPNSRAQFCATPTCFILVFVLFISVGLNLQRTRTQEIYTSKRDAINSPLIPYSLNLSTKEENDINSASQLLGHTTLRATARSSPVELSDNSTLPPILWFTDKHNILRTKDPEHKYKNVLKTIESYTNAFREKANNSTSYAKTIDVQVQFLDDPGCFRVIRTAYPDLVVHFLNETNGSFKGDICRVAALYLYGGYYFDVDMEVVMPYIVDQATNVSFVSVKTPSKRDLFQSFIASTARNPILESAFKFMMDYYEGRLGSCKRESDCLLGTRTLMDAYKSVVRVQPRKTRSKTTIRTVLLQEAPLVQSLYPDFPRREHRDIWCNHIVHDPAAKIVHFYSRIEGSQNCPFLDPDKISATCGGGYIGNGLCVAGCCSQWGWCGTSPQHCGDDWNSES